MRNAARNNHRVAHIRLTCVGTRQTSYRGVEIVLSMGAGHRGKRAQRHRSGPFWERAAEVERTYDVDEEADLEADAGYSYDDADDEAEDDAAFDEEEEAFDSSNAYAAYVDEEEAYADDADDYADDADAADEGEGDDADLLDEEGWDEGVDEEVGSEERALVPVGAWQAPGRRVSLGGVLGKVIAEPYEPEMRRITHFPLPILISGRGRTAPLGALGHAPLAPRAHRPRPFFTHVATFSAGVLLLILVAVFAVVPLSQGKPIFNAFTSLAGSAAPPVDSNIPFQWYTIHYGDTIITIAQQFDVQPGGILELNRLQSTDQIYLGMRLRIPTDRSYGAGYRYLAIPLPPDTIPPGPYGYYVAPPGFYGFAVQDIPTDPFSGLFGQCTWWAQHKRPDENLNNMGDAWNWANGARARGLVVTTTPAPGATVVFAPGVEGASGIGHVAHVEQILTNGWVLISEMNFFWNGGGYARVDYRYISAAPGVWFIH